ncbi:amidophosphoribosyltransferase [Thioclava sp. L04-15]|uniref:ComF family protein n=1 Tax=Thioclava sp. L04-15 TaxID=1915318 RepID=UPI000996B4F4|nr:ComF family protein [Thioclava sp. L04-15]OOY29703.1 amidophosphoribosyltransferase [Thioclava sp. L04-15]TNE89755.1 MAG: ComF family protein [Paracoccaceae bacterium]
MLAAARVGLRALFPPSCIACGEAVGSEFGLCGTCWAETEFARGTVCDACGTPLPGEAAEEEHVLCDDCIAHPRAWAQGRTAMLYSGTGRNLVLALKHGDRLDLVPPLVGWMARAADPLLQPEMMIAPIPLHRLRLLKRRFNQAAELSRALARRTGQDHCADLFLRTRPTASQKGKSREDRHANLSEAIRINPRRAGNLSGRALLIVDDVMTSGATLSAATEAALEVGATRVCIVTLARVAKAP